MTRQIYFVADGPRDEATLPPLVEHVTGVPCKATFSSWQSIKTHRGYDRKVRYAIREAKSRGQEAVVAVVDRDSAKKRQRLSRLADQRHLDHRPRMFPRSTQKGRQPRSGSGKDRATGTAGCRRTRRANTRPEPAARALPPGGALQGRAILPTPLRSWHPNEWVRRPIDAGVAVLEVGCVESPDVLSPLTLVDGTEVQVPTPVAARGQQIERGEAPRGGGARRALGRWGGCGHAVCARMVSTTGMVRAVTGIFAPRPGHLGRRGRRYRGVAHQTWILRTGGPHRLDLGEFSAGVDHTGLLPFGTP